jgi:hypothetical protein
MADVPQNGQDFVTGPHLLPVFAEIGRQCGDDINFVGPVNCLAQLASQPRVPISDYGAREPSVHARQTGPQDP